MAFDAFFKTELEHDAFQEIIHLPEGMQKWREVVMLLAARCWANEYGFYGFKHNEFAAEIKEYLTAKGLAGYDHFDGYCLGAILNNPRLARWFYFHNDFQNKRSGVMFNPGYEMGINLALGVYTQHREYAGTLPE